MIDGLVVLGKGCAGHAHKLVKFVAARRVGEKFFERTGGLRIAAGLVVGHGSSVVAIEILRGSVLGRREGTNHEQGRRSGYEPSRAPPVHVPPIRGESRRS